MLKKAIMALAGAVALAGAFPASATTITLPTTTASNGTIYSSYTANVAAGPFIDSYSFTLPSSAYTISTALVYALGTSISWLVMGSLTRMGHLLPHRRGSRPGAENKGLVEIS